MTQAQTEPTPAAAANVPTAEPTAIDRASLTQLAKIKHGKCQLPDGRLLYFLPSRRSRSFVIESSMYDDNGRLVESHLGTRPARMLAGYMCDSGGNQIFRDDEWETVDALPDSFFIPAWEGLRRHLGIQDEPATDDEKK